MVVVAHPDDDAYGCAGTVALHADDPTFRFVLVHATDGEAGRIAPGSNATRETLGAVRREEDRRAWQVLGRQPDRHEWLGYPDGGLAELPLEELVNRFNARRVARGMQPWDPTRIYHLRGIPDERIDVDIDTCGVAHRVRAAMLEHRTQREDVNSTLFTDSQKVNAVSREPGVTAWPGRPGRILRDLFEDL